MKASELDWNRTLREQWEFHWTHHLRVRLDGLTDDEYFWSRVPDAWSVQPRGSSAASVQVGAEDFTVDDACPEPVPAPFTTIAWRLGHVIVGVLTARNAAHFGAPATSYETSQYAGSAAAALYQLEAQLDVVLHIHRELIHHLSEVCLLRDLYLHTRPATIGAT